jgi:hypothetical protein
MCTYYAKVTSVPSYYKALLSSPCIEKYANFLNLYKNHRIQVNEKSNNLFHANYKYINMNIYQMFICQTTFKFVHKFDLQLKL